jgi:hypothetical protein
MEEAKLSYPLTKHEVLAHFENAKKNHKAHPKLNKPKWAIHQPNVGGGGMKTCPECTKSVYTNYPDAPYYGHAILCGNCGQCTFSHWVYNQLNDGSYGAKAANFKHCCDPYTCWKKEPVAGLHAETIITDDLVNEFTPILEKAMMVQYVKDHQKKTAKLTSLKLADMAGVKLSDISNVKSGSASLAKTQAVYQALYKYINNKQKPVSTKAQVQPPHNPYKDSSKPYVEVYKDNLFLTMFDVPSTAFGKQLPIFTLPYPKDMILKEGIDEKLGNPEFNGSKHYPDGWLLIVEGDLLLHHLVGPQKEGGNFVCLTCGNLSHPPIQPSSAWHVVLKKALSTYEQPKAKQALPKWTGDSPEYYENKKDEYELKQFSGQEFLIHKNLSDKTLEQLPTFFEGLSLPDGQVEYLFVKTGDKVLHHVVKTDGGLPWKCFTCMNHSIGHKVLEDAALWDATTKEKGEAAKQGTWNPLLPVMINGKSYYEVSTKLIKHWKPELWGHKYVWVNGEANMTLPVFDKSTWPLGGCHMDYLWVKGGDQVLHFVKSGKLGIICQSCGKGLTGHEVLMPEKKGDSPFSTGAALIKGFEAVLNQPFGQAPEFSVPPETIPTPPPSKMEWYPSPLDKTPAMNPTQQKLQTMELQKNLLAASAQLLSTVNGLESAAALVVDAALSNLNELVKENPDAPKCFIYGSKEYNILLVLKNQIDEFLE